MENNNGYSVNLTKSVREERKPWTDPVTGEIYPGGNPNETAQPIISQPEVPEMQPTMTIYPEHNNVPAAEIYPNSDNQQQNERTKFCKYCGKRITYEAVVCTYCGRQVELLQSANNPTVINQSVVVGTGTPKNKAVALLLCFFFGWLGVHRFYEGKIATGILWVLTFGVLGIGWLVDFIILIFKPNTYYVK